MTERFVIETTAGFPRDRVTIRVKAKSWGHRENSPATDTAISGSLSSDEARNLGQRLIERADIVAAATAKRDAADQRRQARNAQLPRISFR